MTRESRPLAAPRNWRRGFRRVYGVLCLCWIACVSLWYPSHVRNTRFEVMRDLEKHQYEECLARVEDTVSLIDQTNGRRQPYEADARKECRDTLARGNGSYTWFWKEAPLGFDEKVVMCILILLPPLLSWPFLICVLITFRWIVRGFQPSPEFAKEHQHQ